MESTQDERLSMIRIVSTLYCNDICSDFTRPIEVLYPELKDEYLSIVKYPMDLGTILMNCLNHKMTIETLRRSLQLVFVNALVFNKGTTVMESLAKHLYSFAGELYEEAIGKSYYISDNAHDDNINSRRLRERHHRMLFVENIPLVNTEIKYFLDCMDRVKAPIPNNYSKFVKDIISIARNALGSGINDNITIRKLLSPIATASMQSDPESDTTTMPLVSFPSLFELVVDSKSRDIDNENIHITGNVNILNYLTKLDAALGELLIIVKERATRGIATSSVWARTFRMLWAQPNKGGLFPCMLLAGGPLTNVPSFVSQANWERIPPNIMKQLIKCKPKVPGAPPATINWTKSNISSDYFVVEYFGNHEFGWVRAENVVEMQLGEFTIPPKATHNGPETIREAEEAFNTMNELKNISYLNSKTIVEVPALDELQESIQTGDESIDEVFEKVQDIPASTFTDLGDSLKNYSGFENKASKSKTGSKKVIEKVAKEPKGSKDSKDAKDPKVGKDSVTNSKASSIKIESKTSAKEESTEKRKTETKNKYAPEYFIDFEKIVMMPGETFKESKIMINPTCSRKQNSILKAGFYSKWLNCMRPFKIDTSCENRKRKGNDNEDANKVKRLKEEEKRSPLIDTKPKQDYATAITSTTSTTSTTSFQTKLYSIPMTEKEEAAEIRSRQRVMVFPVPVGSCTLHYKGSGVVHSKTINPHNRIFHYENHSRSRRKAILRREIDRIKKALIHLQSSSQKRDDKPKKIHSAPAVASVVAPKSPTFSQTNIPTFIPPPKPQPMAPKVGLIQKMEQMKKLQALASLHQQHKK